MAALATALFLGIVVGSIYSLSAFGLVLTHRASGVFNFAHGALGMVFAFTYYQLVQGGQVGFVVFTYHQAWRLSEGMALLVVVGGLAPLCGLLLDRAMFRRLRDAGDVVKIVATIGLLVALQGAAGVMWGAGTTLTPASIFSSRVLRLRGFSASVEQLGASVLTVALCIALLMLLKYTTFGIRMRAVVDRPEIAELSGVDSGAVSGWSWAIGSSFAALAGILLAPFFGSLDPNALTFLVIAATAAAVAGRLESFPLTLAGGYAIGIGQLLVQRYAPANIARQLHPSIPFVVLFGLLLLPQWRRRATDRFTVPSLPPLIRNSPKDASTRIGIVTAVTVAGVFLVGPDWQLQFARVPAVALIFLSLVVVSGFGGQVSLCQAALAGGGAFTAAHLSATGHVPFLAAVAIGGLAVVPLGTFLALRAANLSPLFLGFATLAFGAVMDEVAFNSKLISGGLAGVVFARPGWLSSPRTYFLVTLAIFGIAAMLVQNLRRSRTGLALAAMRDSEVGLGSVGTDVARLKLTAFSISAVIAGVGGALLSASDQLATPYSYFKLQSLVFLALAVIGGIGSWLGALAGAVIMQLVPAVLHAPVVGDNIVTRAIFHGQLDQLLPVLFGLGAIGLARNPHGVVEQLRVLFIPRPRRTPAPPAPIITDPSRDDTLVMFPDATFYHRSGCVLTTGKQALPFDEDRRERLAPCPVCEPA